MNNIKGSCLCGKVKVFATTSEKHFDACHCGMCRKWGGGAGMGVHADNPAFEGAENITVYDSSEWAERGFCQHCGTHIFYRMKDKSFYSLPLGLLDGTDDFKFHVQIYIDKKPDNYSFANDTKKMTEEEFLAQFAS